MRKLSLLILLVAWLYPPLAEADDPPTPMQPTPDSASIYVYWARADPGQPVALGVSLFANEQELGPLRSDEYTHIAVPAGMVTLRVLRCPPRSDQVSFPHAFPVPPLVIKAEASAVHYVQFRYRELRGGYGPAVADVEFSEVTPDVALPILSKRLGR